VTASRPPYPELDGRDLLPDTVHYWWQPGDEPLAYLRVLAKPGGGARIGRVCTARQARGSGLATRLTAAALDDLGAAEIVLDSQVHAQGLYAGFGFVPEGEPYEDDDGIPHIRMRRRAARTG
jgi:ElaA protein